MKWAMLALATMTAFLCGMVNDLASRILLVIIGTYLFWMTIMLTGCSTVTLCCPNRQGQIQTSTFDLLGTTSLSCGTNTASVGGPTALLTALLPLIKLVPLVAGKEGDVVTPPAPPAPVFVCQ